ncbi:sulfatase-like hydrolase/transferase [Silvibacterium dinghuense]|uniref:Arylsulfatase n=1 Tax=Silvibacterium dinghuense TaxID=1560006 RepID=A0A4Q1SGH3_9BACT|nr:sulfatase-like hydrolase/transferase [Silvibacterium dinghuense]RXS96423.1 arylsulfatase [Silvibacterium dinghuense]GGG90649.1 sulfatase [Silvibacterium dinghuense]
MNDEGRRAFLKSSVAAAFAAAVPASTAMAQVPATSTAPRQKPNIILYLSDQFRWDFVGANGHNGSTHTPNIDALAARGKNFTHTVTNQPVCAPSRSVLFTSRYATETGVWRNGKGLDETLPTLATELRKAGYSANLIGKWHLAPGTEAEGGGRGAVKAEHRGGFLDLWEGANSIENTSHPYEGTIWDRDNKPIEYKDEYRVDFLTDRAEKFLRQKQDKPFLLFISQLEPHQQNDMGQPIAPKGAAQRFLNGTVPEDLRAFPGTWQAQLPDYYGCIEAIDNSVGRIRKVLEEEHLAENTIFVFLSDHGCHFMTRNQEYKRSTHNSSLRVPLIIDGPGFRGTQQIPELVGLIDVAPTLLEAAGVPVPSSWKGRSVLPLVNDPEARQGWVNEQFIQISESMTGRAIRTKDWTYCVADPSGDATQPAASSYHEYQMYDQRADPHELVNLAGRKEYRAKADELREQLKKLAVAAGEPEPEIVEAKLYP